VSDSPGKAPSASGGIDLTGYVIGGRYHVERRIGEGGFSVTYKALHLALDVSVAIKVLKLPARLTAEHKSAFIQHFREEGKLLFRLGSLHPAITRSFDAGTVEGPDGAEVPFIAMEWLDGVSLEAELQARRGGPSSIFPLAEALQCLRDAVTGLAVAHDEGIAHRDVKPGNIFLLRRSAAITSKILDFGVAKVLGQWPTLTGQIDDTTGHPSAFTPAYGAPEQWLRRLGATGPWTDVYALALVLVEMLSGRRALDGMEGPQLMAACLDAEARPTPRTLGCQVPNHVESVFARALALNPSDRQPNLRAFWSDLVRASGWQPTTGVTYVPIASTPPKATGRPMAATETARPLSMTSISAAASWRDRPRSAWVAGLFVVAAVVAAGTLVAPRWKHAPDRAEVARDPAGDAARATRDDGAQPVATPAPGRSLGPDAGLPVVRPHRLRSPSSRPGPLIPPRASSHDTPTDLSRHEEFSSRK
jgi:serine/threonine-protein kinase